MAAEFSLGALDLLRVLVGLAVFLAPGLAWSSALLRHLGWTRLAPFAIILAFTLEPAVMLGLNLLFNAPINLATGTYLSVALALAAFGVRLRPWVERVVAA